MKQLRFMLNENQRSTVNTRKFWKNENVQTLMVVILVVSLILGFWFGSRIALNTRIVPVLVVSSGSMCIPYDGACDGYTHPFARTLHVGDLIIIQGVNSKDLNSNYPESDIIVFQDPGNPDGIPIVHRITSETEKDGKIYFFTKGDGNPPIAWPSPVEPYAPDLGWYNPNYYNENPDIPRGGVSQDFVLGKVVMRIPWLGWIAIFMQKFQETLNQQGFNIGIPIVVILVALLIIVEFVLPIVRKNKKQKNFEPIKS